MRSELEARRGTSLVDLLDRVLDKGLVINADINIAIGGVQLLDIRIRAAVASLETAALYGLELPGGTDIKSQALVQGRVPRETCPGCSKRQPAEALLESGCPWCGWQSARARSLGRALHLPPPIVS